MYEEREIPEDNNNTFEELALVLGQDLYLDIKLNDSNCITYAKAYLEGENGEIILGGRQTFRFAEKWANETHKTFSDYFRAETRQGLKSYAAVSVPMILEGVKYDGVANCLFVPS